MSSIYKYFVFIISSLILILFILTGTSLVSILTGTKLLTINHELSINDLIDNFLNILNLVIILYIADIINKRAEKDKFEKDIISSQIKTMMTDIDSIYNILPENPEIPVITLKIKNLYLDYKFLTDTITTLSKSPLEERLAKEFVKNFRKFNTACTNKNIPASNNRLSYSTEEIQKINKPKSELKITLLKALSSYI